MDHIFFIQSSVEGQLGFFHNLAIVENAAMNIGVHMALLFTMSVSLGQIPSSAIAGSWGSSIFNFFLKILFTYLRERLPATEGTQAGGVGEEEAASQQEAQCSSIP